MKKYLLIALLVLVLSCFVACDGDVNEELFGGSAGSAGPCWTIKITDGTDVWYSNAHNFKNNVTLYSDETCSVVTSDVFRVSWLYTNTSNLQTYFNNGLKEFTVVDDNTKYGRYDKHLDVKVESTFSTQGLSITFKVGDHSWN